MLNGFMHCYVWSFGNLDQEMRGSRLNTCYKWELIKKSRQRERKKSREMDELLPSYVAIITQQTPLLLQAQKGKEKDWQEKIDKFKKLCKEGMLSLNITINQTPALPQMLSSILMEKRELLLTAEATWEKNIRGQQTWSC